MASATPLSTITSNNNSFGKESLSTGVYGNVSKQQANNRWQGWQSPILRATITPCKRVFLFARIQRSTHIKNWDTFDLTEGVGIYCPISVGGWNSK